MIVADAESVVACSIRLGTEEDYEACLALDHSSMTEYVWQVDVNEDHGVIAYEFRTVRLPREMAVAYPQSSAAMLADWTQPDCFLVAEYDGRIVGYLHMRADVAYSIGWVRQLAVDRSVRRKKIGSKLLRAAQQWAKQHQLRRMMVETQTKNYPAIAFCQRHGFVMSGFNDRYYPNQDIALFFTAAVR